MSFAKTDNQSQLRVLLAGHLPPPIGGIGTFCQSLLHSSLAAKVDLRFVQMSAQDRPLSGSGRLSLVNLWAAAQAIGRFAAALAAHHPHITHIATTYGWSFLKHSVCALLARACHSRVLLHMHCSFAVFYVQRPRWWQWYVRCILRLASGLIVPSREWLAMTAVVPGVPVHYLPNAVDLKPYRAIAQEHLRQAPASRPLSVLHLGYLGRAKGVFDLVDAACLLAEDGACPAIHLVGSELQAGERQALCSLIAAKGLAGNVFVHPAAGGEEKLAWLRGADVFVLPSYHEGMPMAVLEAMACALPIVATPVGGLPDLVIHGSNGLLVPPGQPALLAAALGQLAADPTLRARLRERSYQMAVECYDMELLVERLLAIYSGAGARRSPAELHKQVGSEAAPYV